MSDIDDGAYRRWLAREHPKRLRARRRITYAQGPWRTVATDPAPDLHEGRGSVLGPDTDRRTRWWQVVAVECGHVNEKTVKYTPEPNGRRLRHRTMTDVKPPPKRIRCDYCPREETPVSETPTPKVSGKAADSASTSTLEPTHVECTMGCDRIFLLEPGDEADVCPECAEAADPVHSTAEPLGYDDDEDYFHHGRKRYEYPAQEPARR